MFLLCLARRLTMSEKTPERDTSASSRNPTPHSRRTPVRTPRRRRATIVSANLLTPRRLRRPSETPQNSLRILSRALSRKTQDVERERTPEEEQSQFQDHHEDQQEQHDHQQSSNLENQLEFNEIPAQELEMMANFHDYFDFRDDQEKVYETQVEDPGNDDEMDHSSNILHSAGDIENRRRESMRYSERLSQNGLSDIALPIGLMPDEALESDLFPHPFQFDQNIGKEVSASPSSINPLQLFNAPSQNQIRIKPAPRNRVPSSRTLNPLSSKKVTNFAQAFARKSLSKEASITLQQTSDSFFDRIADDLKSYTKYSKNKETLNIRSIYLLLKRQRHVNSIASLLELIDELLPLEEVLEVRRNLHKLQR